MCFVVKKVKFYALFFCLLFLSGKYIALGNVIEPATASTGKVSANKAVNKAVFFMVYRCFWGGAIVIPVCYCLASMRSSSTNLSI